MPTVAWCAFAGSQWCARRPLTSTYAQLALAAQPRDAAGVLDPACAPCLGLCGPAPVKAVVPGLGFRLVLGADRTRSVSPTTCRSALRTGAWRSLAPTSTASSASCAPGTAAVCTALQGPWGSHPSRLGLAVRPSQSRSGGHQYLITSLTSGAASVLHNDSAAQAFSRGSMHAFNPSRM